MGRHDGGRSYREKGMRVPRRYKAADVYVDLVQRKRIHFYLCMTS